MSLAQTESMSDALDPDNISMRYTLVWSLSPISPVSIAATKQPAFTLILRSPRVLHRFVAVRVPSLFPLVINLVAILILATVHV